VENIGFFVRASTNVDMPRLVWNFTCDAQQLTSLISRCWKYFC